MHADLHSRAEEACNNGFLLCAKTAELIARFTEDQRLRVALADSIRFSSDVDRLIATSIDDLDVADAAALLRESRELEDGIASLRGALTRGPWVFR